MPVKKEIKPVLSLSELASGAFSRLEDSEIIDLSKADSLALTIRVTHNSAATNPVRVHLKSSPDGSVWDTDDYAYFDAHLKAGQESQKTMSINADAFYLRVQLENQDTSQTATDIDVIATIGHKK
jgi:hypothetical protein